MITPIPIAGLGKLEKRAYLLLSLAVGGLTAADNPDRQTRAVQTWRRFIGLHPQFKSPLVGDDEASLDPG